jgi:Plasmid pRiA4b ORF-3-like protein
LREVLRTTGDHAAYWYDFGDDWYHDVLLESVLPANAVAHPVCIGGRRAGPLEDSGGIHSYQQMCAALADSGHPDHAAGRQWLEQVHGWIAWDPAQFDRAGLNRRLAEIVLPPG